MAVVNVDKLYYCNVQAILAKLFFANAIRYSSGWNIDIWFGLTFNYSLESCFYPRLKVKTKIEL